MNLKRYNAQTGTAALGDNSFQAFSGWEGVSTSIANGASSLWSGIKSGLGTIADGVRSAYNYVTDGISNTATGIVNLFGSATAAIAGLWRGRRQEERVDPIAVENLANQLFACFVKGTKVLTANGYKNIEEIQSGDDVYSFNTKDEKADFKKVVQVFQNKTDKIFSLTLSDTRVIETTQGHPFYVKNKGFVLAKNLKAKDVLFDNERKEVCINKIEIHEVSNRDTFNFEVEDYHTYYVSESKILVHNSSIPEGTDKVQALVNHRIRLLDKKENGELTLEESKQFGVNP